MTSETQFDRVGVIGAGVMGAGVAQSLAQNGHRVIALDLTDEVLERAPKSGRACGCLGDLDHPCPPRHRGLHR